MNGGPPWSPGPAPEQAAPFARGKRSSPGTTTCPRCFRRWRPSGMQSGTGAWTCGRFPLQQPPGLVAVRSGPPVAVGRQRSGPGQRLPLLHRPKGFGGIQRPGDHFFRRSPPNGTPPLNGGLTPQMVTVGSHQKVWWVCSEGHVWKAVVYSRTGAQSAAARCVPERSARKSWRNTGKTRLCRPGK